MNRYLVALAALVLAACNGGPEGGMCRPVGFTTCVGNNMITCVGMPGQDGGGMTTAVDCTATGQVCIRNASGGVCGQPILGEVCLVRDVRGCASGDQLLRCVWISEQPEPGFSGELGVWRLQTDCAMSGQTCPANTAACRAP